MFGILHFKWMYHSVNNPKANFQITGNQNADITLVEFISYSCEYCRQVHPAVKEALEIRKDIRYIARPLAFGQENSQRLTRIVLAAGLQGKFWELHDAFLEYPETEIPDEFIEETALLYGLDYKKLIEDSESKKVRKMAENNMAALEHAGIKSVPSFVIGGRIYVIGNSGVPDLKQLLEIIAQAEQ